MDSLSLLWQEAENIQKILPWIDDIIDIIHYMSKIPSEFSNRRVLISLDYFLKLRDECEDNIKTNIENDARDIENLLPDTDHNALITKLESLGNVPNRKEVAIRQLLKDREDLSSIQITLSKKVSDLQNSNIKEISEPSEPNLNESSEPSESNLNEMSEPSEPIEFSLNEIPEPIGDNLNEMELSESSDAKLNEMTEMIERNLNEISEPVHDNLNEMSEPINFSLTDISEFIKTKEQEISKFSDPDGDEIAEPSEPNLTEITLPFNQHAYRNHSRDSDFQMTCNTNMIVKSSENSLDSRDITTAELLNLDLSTTSVSSFDNMEDTPNAATRISFEDACRMTISTLTSPANSSNKDSTQRVNQQNRPTNQQSFNNASAGVYSSELLSLVNLSKTPIAHTATVTSQNPIPPVPATTAYGGIVPDRPRSVIQFPIMSSLYNGTVYGNPQVNPEIRVRPDSELLMDNDRLRRYDLLNNFTITSSSALNLGRETMKRPHSVDNGIVSSNPFLNAIQFDPLDIPAYLSQNNDKCEAPRRRIVQKAKSCSFNDAVQLVPSTSTSHSNIKVKEVSNLKPSLTNPKSVYKEMLVEEISDDSIPDESVLDDKLVRKLMEVFPDACSDFIKRISRGKTFGHLNELINDLLENEYPKRSASPPKEFDPEEQFEFVKALLPDADPTYLRLRCEGIGNDPEALNAFINNARELKNYPTMKEYLQKQKFSAQCKQYTVDFDVERFTEVFPDPEGSFKDASRKCEIDEYAKSYINKFFRNRYCKLSVAAIQSTLRKKGYRIMACDEALREIAPDLKRSRAQQKLVDPPLNLAVLQEIAYLTHKEKIEHYLKELKEKKEADRRAAKENGLFQTCQCCFDDEVMPNELFNCPKGCEFCGSCIKKSCEITMGNGEINFKCLNDCTEEFSIVVLQKVLPPKMFSVLAQKKAVAEVKAAGIEDLETCPFCDFASIPNGADRIFRCLNPDCMKESCRSCKNENHIPYRCDEVEKDDEVKARVFIENQMTEALVRTCWRCKRSFFKEEGCNKMTCACGARMCYICRQPVTDYSHFNGIGGDKHHLCPLYSDNVKLNHQSVVEAAETAKSQVDASKLKVDPTADLDEHYKKRAKKLPVEPHVHVLHRFHGAMPRAQFRLQGAVPRQPHRGRGRRPGHIH